MREFGYNSYHFHTCDRENTGYSGTAILSRVAPEAFLEGWADKPKLPDDEGRVLAAIFPRVVVIHTYSPSTGFDKPDREKFRRKHDKRLRHYSKWLREKYSRPVMLIGDLNVTPELHDVWDGQCNEERQTWPGCKPFERYLFKTLKERTGLVEGYSYFEELEKKTRHPGQKESKAAIANRFTFWRTARDRVEKKGWKLDHFMLDPVLLHSEAKSQGFPYVRQVDHHHRIFGSDHIPVSCIVWEAETDVVPKEQEPVLVGPLSPPLVKELDEAQELLQSTSAKRAEAKLEDPYLDASFAPDLDDEFLFNLDKELDDDREFAASDIVACLRYRKDLQGQRDTWKKDALLRMNLRAARMVTATVPMLPTIVGDQHIDVLADSGASYSIISATMAQRLRGPVWRQHLVTSGFQPRFEMADGRFSGSIGRLMLPIRFRHTDKPVQHSFFVLEALGPVAILGVNFFMRTGAVIDFAKQRIVFRRLHRVKAVPFQIKQGCVTARGAVCPVLLEHDLTLQPNESADTMGYLENADPLYGSFATGIIEGCGSDLRPITPVATCITKFNKRARAPIRLLNGGNEVMRVAKGSLVGYFTPIPVVPKDDRYLSEHCQALTVLPQAQKTEVDATPGGTTPATEEKTAIDGAEPEKEAKAVIDLTEEGTPPRETEAKATKAVRFAALPDRTVTSEPTRETRVGIGEDGKIRRYLTSPEVKDTGETLGPNVRGTTRASIRHGGTGIRYARLLPRIEGARLADDDETEGARLADMRGNEDSPREETNINRTFCMEGFSDDEKEERPAGTADSLREREAEPYRRRPQELQPATEWLHRHIRAPNGRSFPVAASATVPPEEKKDQEQPDFIEGVPEEMWGELRACKQRVTEDQYRRLLTLVRRFADVFYQKGTPISTIKGVQIRINIPEGTKPVATRGRNLNPAQREVLIEYVKKLEKQGVVEHVHDTGGWLNQILFVKKPDGTLRPCIDMRRGANTLSRPLISTLPNMQDCVDCLSGAKYITIQDAKAAYFQMELHPDDRKYTAFSSPLGNYVFKRAAMGFVSSQQEWINAMDTVLGDLQWKSTIAFSDDIATFSQNFDQHLNDLEALWTRLREFNVSVSPAKMQIARPEVSYVGYIVGQHGVSPDPQKLEAISLLEPPDSLKSLRSFLGITGYWRRFVKDYARIAEPLRPLLQKGKFTTRFSKEQLEAFEDLKSRCVNAPVLAHPRFDKQFTIMADGSPDGIGAVLLQEDDEGRMVAVAYFSKALTPAQQSYAQCEIETLALLASLELWNSYFSGTTVRCITDCDSLKYLLKPDSKYTGRQLRWLLRLSSFDIDLETRPSKQNVVADFLSRHPTVSEYGNHVFDLVGHIHNPTRLVLRGGTLQRVPSDGAEPPARKVDESGEEDEPSPEKAAEKEQRAKTEDKAKPSTGATMHPDRARLMAHRAVRRRQPTAAGKPAVTRSQREAQRPASPPDQGADSKNNPRPKDQDRKEHKALEAPAILAVEDRFELQALFRDHQAGDATCLKARETIAKARGSCSHQPGQCVDTCPLTTCKFKVDEVDGLVKRKAGRGVPAGRTHVVVVPKTLVTCVLRSYHSLPITGHPGSPRMIFLIKRNFYWANMDADITRWAKACLVCAKRKKRRRFGTTEPGSMKTSAPWDVCAIDIVGPLYDTSLKHRYALTMIDCFSKYPIVVPLQTTDANEIARALFEHLIANHACPKVILSDNASNFCGKVMDVFTKLFNIRHIKTVAYTPQLNSFLERYHSWLSATLTALSNSLKDDWHKWLPVALYVYRTSTHAATGYSPMEVLTGRSPNTDMDLAFPIPAADLDETDYMSELHANMRRIHTDVREKQRRAAAYNLGRRLKLYKPHDFKEGDFVLVNCPPRVEKLPTHLPRIQKMLDSFLGPFRITGVIKSGSSRRYKLLNTERGEEEIYRAETLSLYTPWGDDGEPSVPQRKYIPAGLRRTMNKQELKHLPKHLEPGDMVIFPRTMPGDDSPGFGVAKVLRRDSEENWECQWFSNGSHKEEEKLDGPYLPCWMGPDGWYTRRTPRDETHEPLLTSRTYGWNINREVVAECGFQLDGRRRVPDEVLDLVEQHRLFKWKRPAVDQ